MHFSYTTKAFEINLQHKASSKNAVIFVQI